ncbi:hypothetical protein H0E87_010021 [Populus deltoides]|uniref:Uncharacterized protein n=1 Tax=Populus deltoides TaxID=3696 RepID=A0A8T2YRA9_POPDE|nr:hypothetical protein H0E87_010021 [Populus deltoides]
MEWMKLFPGEKHLLICHLFAGKEGVSSGEVFLGIMEEKNVVALVGNNQTTQGLTDSVICIKSFSLKPQCYSTANNQMVDRVEKEGACNGVINSMMGWRLFVHRTLKYNN